MRGKGNLVRAERKFSRGIAWVVVLLTAAVVSGCVSRKAVTDEYEATLRFGPRASKAPRTVLLFLIDGLSTRMLREALAAGRVDALCAYFLAESGEVHEGRAPFPSLTYPSISTVLTARPMDQQPVVGNVMWVGDDKVDFQSPFSVGKLNRLLEKISVFTALGRRGQRSASFDYYYHPGSTAEYPTDLEAGIEYTSKEFDRVDAKLVASLRYLLDTVSPPAWPSFVFLHLIGVDALAHLYGPDSVEVKRYLSRLDGMLAPILRSLERADAGAKEVVTLLTSDHGFVSYDRYFDLESRLKQLLPQVRVANETRFLSLGFPPDSRERLQASLVGKLSDFPHAEILAVKTLQGVHIETPLTRGLLRYAPGDCRESSYTLRFEVEGAPAESAPYQCPESLDVEQPPLVAPYFLSSLATYFHSPNSADAILVAAPGVAFSKGQKGGHGGFSPEELVVPILLRNAEISYGGNPLPTYKLLRPLFGD